MNRFLARESQCCNANAGRSSSKPRLAWPIFVLIAAWLVLSGCGGGDAKPPDIAYGVDLCERCGMVIDEPRFAAAIVFENGGSHKFDDAGEMFAYRADHAAEAVRAWFVHDYTSKVWLRGETSFYVVSKKVTSPMGTGVAAFGVRAEADAFAQGLNAKVLVFDEAQRQLAVPGKR